MLIILECVWCVDVMFGEGVVWYVVLCCVVFVDIKGRWFYCYDLDIDVCCSWIVFGQIGFVLFSVDGGLVCGVQGGFYWFDFVSGIFSCVLLVEIDWLGNCLNDGYVDCIGVLWFGLMDDVECEVSGQFYCVGWDGWLSVCDLGYVIMNGLFVSFDGCMLYYMDILQCVVYVFDFDDDGILGCKCVFILIEGIGYLDGMVVDEEGCVWVVLFGGGWIEWFLFDG